MGLIRTEITLKNPKEPAIEPVVTAALVDTGALHLCVPRQVAERLGLEQLYEREVTIADGTKCLCPYVGPVEVRFGDRACFAGAIVVGEEVMLGAVPMEDMDLVISPATRSVTVNPVSPDVPSSILKVSGCRICC